MLAVASRAMRGERRAFDAPGQLLASSQLSAEMLFNPFGKLQFGATPHRQACLLQRSTDDMLHNALPCGTSHLRHALVKAALLLSFFKHVASLANHDCARSLLRGFSKCARHTDKQKTRTLAEPSHAHKACAHSAQRPSQTCEKVPTTQNKVGQQLPSACSRDSEPKATSATSTNAKKWHQHQHLLDLHIPVHVPIFLACNMALGTSNLLLTPLPAGPLHTCPCAKTFGL